MCAVSTVGVDDDFAAGETGVAVRAANHELARRVDEQFMVVVEGFEQLLDISRTLFDDARYQDVADVLFDLCQHGIVLGFFSSAVSFGP